MRSTYYKQHINQIEFLFNFINMYFHKYYKMCQKTRISKKKQVKKQAKN